MKGIGSTKSASKKVAEQSSQSNDVDGRGPALGAARMEGARNERANASGYYVNPSAEKHAGNEFTRSNGARTAHPSAVAAFICGCSVRYDERSGEILDVAQGRECASLVEYSITTPAQLVAAFARSGMRATCGARCAYDASGRVRMVRDAEPADVLDGSASLPSAAEDRRNGNGSESPTLALAGVEAGALAAGIAADDLGALGDLARACEHMRLALAVFVEHIERCTTCGTFDVLGNIYCARGESLSLAVVETRAKVRNLAAVVAS